MKTLVLVITLLFLNGDGIFLPPYPCQVHPCIYQPRPPVGIHHTVSTDNAAIVLDDEGVINNADNPRGNVCYNPGVVCQTEEQWIRGWYAMHGMG